MRTPYYRSWAADGRGQAVALGREAGFSLRAPRDRPRERLEFLGAEGLNDDELVALVLGSGAAVPAARLLLDRAGGAAGLRRTGLSELRGLPGIGPARAAQLKAALELGRRALLPEPLPGYPVRSAADIAELLQAELGHGEQEALHVFGLDARHRIRCRHIAALGQVDRVQVGIADVYRPLVREGMAAALVAHNHPSGEPLPSPQDEALTLRIAQVGQVLGIPLLDHVVVARGGYFSFSEEGRLDEGRRPRSAAADGAGTRWAAYRGGRAGGDAERGADRGEDSAPPRGTREGWLDRKR